MSRNVSIMFLLQNSNERHDIPQRRLQVSKKLSVRGIKLYHENTLSVQDSSCGLDTEFPHSIAMQGRGCGEENLGTWR